MCECIDCAQRIHRVASRDLPDLLPRAAATAAARMRSSYPGILNKLDDILLEASPIKWISYWTWVSRRNQLHDQVSFICSPLVRVQNTTISKKVDG